MSRHKSEHYKRNIDPVQTDSTLANADITENQAENALQSSDNVVEKEGDSPTEEKIHQLSDAIPASPVNGWENDMFTAPVDGSRIMVSETGEDQGSLVYWRISKYVDKKNLRYVPRGRWTDFLSKVDITFSPKYWKLYNPEEYWPMQGGAA